MQSTRSERVPVTSYIIQFCTHVSCVPKKKIGILLGGGFTAPSATSSICKQARFSSIFKWQIKKKKKKSQRFSGSYESSMILSLLSTDVSHL